MEKAYRYRFYPNTEQENLLRRTMGCARLVYNRALAYRTESWYDRQERIGYGETSSMLTNWKKQEELDFLNEVSCVPLQQGLRHLQTAFTNFFAGRAKYPNFKKKHNGGSAEFTKSAFRWKNRQVFLAKCSEPLPIRWSKQIPQGCIPSTITVKLTPAGRWFVSILVDDYTIQSLPKIDKTIGLDVGITSLIATSDGDKIANPKPPKKLRKKLKRKQKALARKRPGSNNREKARRQVAKVHAQIVDVRKDFLHKLTTKLVRENQTIVVEDLAIKNMVKNHKLALAISDASWGELIRQLSYKCDWYGRDLIKIDRWFPSSKRCGNCGHIVQKLSLNIREWECPKCRTNHDRDINAAKNILAAGLAVSVCGATVRPEESKSRKAGAMKQKPNR
ncbi:MAG: transposase [Microcoleus sp. PH2017_10_PVI_O_A]|uniref:RNA-guided endonuclease InsQ/TnpB family protein n=1 Tax=unclassified Microcoleus TaxID=2642155 RepID=UPI001D87EC94|nr:MULTISPECIES: RNA-guided endonuclease TnpB family protein [unclassified Microcoleus]TAE85552.1 MAG: transposase [Oscillatoriales cyanobacterium]MCC3404637.1 transposase [Microcoleus sp. PH2017_10_PVI_O_A]MCC3458663.1 transposase [Microcoleus sp. PH2017_11_PCY_U_A]MCC3476929.1 transposase [Microcoleus sp. PH2017_12_PCY_D_A]MCC3526504.1 transposase [Microcoleus sp. PH2017_21_RUC_O_A]